MSCIQDSMVLVQPGTARVLVTEMSGSGQLNPTPAVFEDSDMLVDLYLSPTKLKSLSGTEDISQVSSLEICVDTRENTLGNFGAYLPRLLQLKLNNSMITSVRDLGTTLAHLQVLWMSRCSLVDLDGIPSFTSLKELYVAYNSISDLSQVSMLEHLQLLDLEGNDVDDLVQVQYLGLCSELRTLTLEGNPVCVCPHPNAIQTKYCYRSAVRELVPQLRFLDDVRAEQEVERGSNSSSMEEDWALLRQSIKEPSNNPSETATEERAASVCALARPSSGQRPGSSLSCSRPASRPVSSRPHSSAGSRPPSAAGASRTILSPQGSRPGSAESEPETVDPDASILTHGAGKILFCGNPVQALRARRQKMKQTAPPAPAHCAPPLHVPEHTYDLGETDGRERCDVFSELRAWREHHNKRLLAIEKEGFPQPMTYLSEDDEDEEDSLSVTLGLEEEEGKEMQGNRGRLGANSSSPDFLFHSPSPDLLQREAISPEVARLSMSPDSTPSPSPPLSSTASPAGQGRLGIRARRLRLSQAGVSPAGTAAEAGLGRADLGELQRLQEGMRPRTPQRPQTAHLPHRPASSPLGSGLREPWREAGVPTGTSVNGHQPIIMPRRPPERLAAARPRTARAALQKPPPCPTLQPSRGSSHLD
ncbi:leucine-rich repeat-containing protein 56 isoform X1 [Osmerus eperlanus]|uniref:leucine-rich repeat-containing protein 56 isoform X1 n=1 Tax=Osmerus eperlanus TaxID=29151 RepID=UPI002E0D6180